MEFGNSISVLIVESISFGLSQIEELDIQKANAVYVSLQTVVNTVDTKGLVFRITDWIANHIDKEHCLIIGSRQAHAKLQYI